MKVSKKNLWISGLSVLVIALITYYIIFSGSKKSREFTFANATRGKITQTILSTGTLQAVTTIDVGTQVSGRIAKIFVDFNNTVRKGQLLAILDTTTLVTQVRDARATVEKAKAEYHQAQVTHEKNKKLYEQHYISELDFVSSQTNVESAHAALKSAESSLERATTNLSYAYIYAPISGKIQNRAVEEGQTVAASLSAPTLFTIAGDLSHMKILVNVDESDIGQISLGQKVDFTVQAFPEKKFWGEVVQIRINSQVISNVVNYTVVVNADNKDNLLLPGMTATTDFYIQEKDSVLLVPNASLRFAPPDDMLAEYTKEHAKSNGNTPDSMKQFSNRQALGGKPGKAQFGKIWYFDENNKLQMARAFLGITDGKSTEIVKSKNITDGMKIITGMVDNSVQATNQQRSVLTQQPGATGPGMRRGM
ncbi:MAG: efflux RND transporter periplasmic adaptor subunit [Ignavibacteria bacterium]|nr:efflux RND transporter periplasmic adaptor subunit [Ignavibacteria bacterium]